MRLKRRGVPRPAPVAPRWYDARGNVVVLAHWLLERNELSAFTADALYLFEKPWKWDEEWQRYSRWLAGERCKGGGLDYECPFLPHECKAHNAEEAFGE